MSEILDKIDKAETKLAEFKKLAAQVYKEANADGVIDAEERREIAAVAQQIKGVQGIVQNLKDEFERNKAAWEAMASQYETFNTQLADLIAWGKPDINPVDNKSKELVKKIADQSFKEAKEFLESAESLIKPLVEEYLIQKVAKEVYETAKATLETAASALAVFPLQSEFIKTRVLLVTDQISDTVKDVAEFQFSTAKEVVEKCVQELKEAEDEAKRLETQKNTFDEIYNGMKQRINEAKGSLFKALALSVADMAKMETGVNQCSEEFDYDQALTSVETLNVCLVDFEKQHNQLTADKTLYQERLDGLRPELLDASMCSRPDMAVQINQMTQIRARMDAAAAVDDYTKALLEMDSLVTALDAFKTALALAIAKDAYQQKLALLQPQIFAAAVSNYGPLAELAGQIATDYEAAEGLAAKEDYDGALGKLNAIEPNLNRYFSELPQIEQAEALYNGQIGPITERFNDLASSEYPDLTANSERIIELFDGMKADAAQGDYPAAVAKSEDLTKLMGESEVIRDDLDRKREFYEAEIGALLPAIQSTIILEFAALADKFSALETDRDKMLKAAELNDFANAFDMMGFLMIDLDAVALLVAEQEAYKLRYQDAFKDIEENLKTVTGCTYPELVTKRDVITTITDQAIALADQTLFVDAYNTLQPALDLIRDFIKQEAACDDYTRRHGFAKIRIDKLSEITFETLEKDKTAIKTAFETLTAEAMTGEVLSALDKLIQLDKDLKKIEDVNQQHIGLERAFDIAVENLKADVAAVAKNTFEDAKDEAKAVADAYQAMKDLGIKDKFEEGVAHAKVVTGAIADYYNIIEEIGDIEEKFNALKIRTKENLDTAKTRAEDFPANLGDMYDTLKDDWGRVEGQATEGDFEEALKLLGELDTEIGSFNTRWLALGKEKSAYDAASGPAIERYGEFPEDEAKKKAETEYKAAGNLMKSMKENATEEKFGDAMTDLTAFKAKMDEIDEKLKTEGEHNAEYDGRYEPLKKAVEALSASPYKDKLDDERGDAETALADMKAAGDRSDYQTAMQEAENVDAALKRHNDAEDVLEQDAAGDKAKYDERISGLKPRYEKAKGSKGDFIDDDLAERIEALETEYDRIVGSAADDYEKAWKDAGLFRTEVDAVLDAVTAAELAAANDRADEAEEELEEEEEKDIWDYLEEKGIELAKKTGGELLAEAAKTIGGPAEDIYNFGDSLVSLGDSISDGDIEGIFSNGLSTLKNGLELHPGKQAYKRLNNAITIAEKGWDLYETGKKAWNLID